MEDRRDTLTRQTTTALVWNYAGAAVRMGLALLVGVALARLLGPGPFGLVAIGALVLGIGSLVAELGLGPALVQRATICDQAIRYVFTMQLTIGVLLTAATLALAPAVAWAMGVPAAGAAVAALSPVFAIQATGATAAALLRRSLRFQTLQMADITSYVIGYCAIGLPLALNGAGVWSLIAAQLVQSAIFTVACYACTLHSIVPTLRAPDSGLRTFGWQVLRTNLTNWLIGNFDNMVIGRSFPAVGLGLYSRVFSLLWGPVTALVSTLQRVLFPAYSRAQDNMDRTRRAYLASIALVSLMTIPAYGCAALLAPVVVGGLLGPGWEGAANILAPLAIAMPLHALMALGGPMLWASNKVRDEARAQLFTALACVLAFITAASYSMTCVAWAVVVVYAVRFFLVTRAVLFATQLKWAEIFVAARGGLLVLAVTAPVVLSIDRGLSSTAESLRLGLDLATGTIVAVLVTLAAPRMTVGPLLAKYLAPFAERGPAAIRGLLTRVGVAGGVR